jgi:hypothetical protein
MNLFNGLANQENIYLSFNEMKIIHEKTFSGLANLVFFKPKSFSSLVFGFERTSSKTF